LYNILKAVQSELNFTFDLIKSVDNIYGDLLPNNTWAGQIGLVQRREIDLSVMDIYIVLERAQVHTQIFV
jgi:hypothetical protein